MPQSHRLLRPKRGIISPTNLGTVALWLKADTGLYQDDHLAMPALLDGDPVGAWLDQTANGLIFTNDPPTATLYIPDKISYVRMGNGVPAKKLTGPFINSANYSFAALVLVEATPSLTVTVLEEPSGDKKIAITTTPNAEWTNDASFIPSAFTLSGLVPAGGPPFVICGRVGSALLLINNTQVASTSKTPTTGWTNLKLGGDETGLDASEINLAELIIWDDLLTDSQLAAAYQYFSHKYSL